MYRLFVIVLAVILASNGSLSAQNYSVSGRLSDAGGGSLPEKVVSLLYASDSSSVAFYLTDSSGSFLFKDVRSGAYLLTVQAIGYQQLTQHVPVHSDVKDVHLVLKASASELKEVSVLARKPVIETAPGKIIMNVSGVTVSAGNSALDLLRKAPGVQVQGSNITMQGYGVLVLIDDKQTHLTGDELADYLKSLPADQVAQVELITQPSSKYDAEGSGGIINIKTNRIRGRGFNGNLSLAAGQNVYPNTHNSLNFSLRHNRLTLYANTGYFIATGGLTRTVDQVSSDPASGRFLNSSYSHSVQKETFSDYSMKLGADYAVSEKFNLGGSVRGIYHPNDEHDETYTTMSTGSAAAMRNGTFSDLGFLRNHYIANGFLKYIPRKGSTLTFDADYISRIQKGYLILYSVNTDQTGQQMDDLSLRNTGLSDIQATVFKCDYETAMVHDWKLELGLKASFSSTENGVHFERLVQDNWIFDTSRSNTFIYKENINAAYVSAQKDFNRKWKAQLGLRAEQTNAKGRQIVNDRYFIRSATSLFPTAFVSYAPSEKSNFELNCGRHISRPAYTQLNPFILFRSQFSYFQGNPDLAAAYEWFSSLRHSLNNKLFTTIRYGYTSGVITPSVRFDASNNAAIATLMNFASHQSLSFSVNGSRQFYEWWSCRGNGGIIYNAYTDFDRNKAIASATGFYFTVENEFTIRKGWSIDTSYHYAQGDLQTLLDRYGSRHWLGINVSKKMWDDSATIRLSVDDPFNMNRVNSAVSYNGITSTAMSKWNTQQVALGFTYRFGNSKDRPVQRQTMTEEARRM